jgi:hypothetical protein
MASSPPPKKSKPASAAPKVDVSRFRIDDPTAAFPIGSLGDPEALDDDAMSPVTADAEAKAKPPKKGGSQPGRTPAPAPARSFVVAGVDLRWLVLSLVAGATLAVAVVGLFSLVVLLVRS